MATALSINDGWLKGAAHLDSPNCSPRAEQDVISLLLIHNISLPPGEFGGTYIDQLFLNTLPRNDHPYFQEIADHRVSSHLLIDRAGELRQYVPFSMKAWHAGESCFEGRANCNDFSIGIELEGTDNEPFTGNQYEALAAVTRLLLEEYPNLSADRIVGHSDVAPGRKTDPGPCFDWHRYKASVLASA